jgi:hypothetical protein
MPVLPSEYVLLMALFEPIYLKRKPGRFPANRVCLEPDCETRLHTRHEGKRCYVHETQRPEATEHEQRESFEDLMADVAA